MTVFVRKSKTDKEKRGTFRTLYGVPSLLCPVKAVAAFISAKRAHYYDSDRLFSGKIASRIQNI